MDTDTAGNESTGCSCNKNTNNSNNTNSRNTAANNGSNNNNNNAKNSNNPSTGGDGGNSALGSTELVSTPITNSSVPITVHIHPTTGGHFDLQVAHSESVDCLKKLIAKKLKVPKERLCLLYRERHLREGSLQQNSVMDGCKITLLPSVETGLLLQRPEQSVMQALESLSDAQVSDFLSGKAPLNLTMRLGDHMMFIQLQLSTVAPSGGRKPTPSPQSPSSSAMMLPLSAATSSSAAAATTTTATSTSSSSSSSSSTSSTSSSSSASSVEDVPPTPSASYPPLTPQWSGPVSPRSPSVDVVRPVLDTKALAEASRNLTQTLRQLSSAALSSRTDNHIEDSAPIRRRQGAIIESMHHHGRGVYSGTFSGTLNPALQDKHGRPKRDISTIIHILNDLLGATPQYRRHGNHGPSPSAQSKFVTERLGPNKSQEEYHRLTLENRATRGKMEQLQVMLEERRARRQARREARAPYTWSANSKAALKATSSSTESPCETVETMETSVNDNAAPEFHQLSTTETIVA